MKSKYENLADDIRKLIAQGIRSKGSTRSGRQDNIIHATDLFDFCLRKYFLAQKHDIPINIDRHKRVPGLELTFRLGEKIEAIVLEALQPYLVGDLSTCKTCGAIRYNAPLLKHSVGRFTIVGHVDAAIEYNNSRYILEIKSIDKDYFKDLEEPQLKHAWQLQTYIYLKRKVRYPKIKNVGFIAYISKGYNNSPIKVFPVVTEKNFLDHMKKITQELKTFSKRKVPPRVCTNRLYPLARNCPVVDVCFPHGGKE